MLLTKEQLCMSLSTLANDDYTLLNDIIIDYVYNKLNNKELQDYEDYINNNMNELMWTLLTTTVMLLNVIITECNKHLLSSPKFAIIKM